MTNDAVSGNEGPRELSYAWAANEPTVPVISKDDYIEWLEGQLNRYREARAELRAGLFKLVEGVAELPL